MPGPEKTPDFPNAEATPRSRWRLQVVWLVPVLAVLIGGWLAVKAVIEKGPTITISFLTADGLEAGKTKVKFKNVDIGLVKTITLTPDHERVIATADINKNATNMLVDTTRFWVVRPRISGGTVSGIGTLLSGSYIEMDVGKTKAERREFVGLETPPAIANDVPGREFILKSTNMGSLDVGTPVYFRRLQVGQISGYKLDPDGHGVTLRVFINAPYDKFVLTDTRFWHASGVDVTVGSGGIQVNTQSLVSIMIGGVAFESLPNGFDDAVAATDSTYTLFPDRADAMKAHYHVVVKYVADFTESVRGLTVGAPVDFRGIVVGEVTAIYTRFDPKTQKFTIPVEIDLYPELFTSRYEAGAISAPGGRVSNDPHALADRLVARGLRLQLKTGNLLTGQLYLAADFFPDAPKATVNWASSPPELPTVPGNLQRLQDNITQLVAKLNTIPFDAIGKNARETLASAKTLLNDLDTMIVPQAQGTLAAAHAALDSANNALQPDSALQQNATDMIQELSRTATAFRTLADYLERHPEALIRGKQQETHP
ncbi:Intermembrane transport protein PqiB [Paraburkholderia caffeinitolerans]|uniref:Intermembrane transport protein PqiB n=1 Tax=Paraburkholderia caffeinitolerans TaxID=1723730 RepID=A0A6J5GBI3_9BURK|nr:MlaD family protein [Paraburkholderia caffeinitolerans]CAB3797181.1 Intermembrane transport protein PqiB [Paraburkholderia caffeinitolerans]